MRSLPIMVVNITQQHTGEGNRYREMKRRSDEIVSLNEGLFSLEAGNLSIEALDRRLELAVAIAGGFGCKTFICTDFSSCGSFECGTFTMPAES